MEFEKLKKLLLLLLLFKGRTILFSINHLIIWSTKCQKIKKTVCYFSLPEGIYSQSLFYSTKRPKPKDNELTIIYDKSIKSSHLRSWNQGIGLTVLLEKLIEQLMINWWSNSYRYIFCRLTFHCSCKWKSKSKCKHWK